MTRETKIGLLVGLAFIIVIGILLSDHLTSSTEPPPATLANAGNNVRQTVTTPGGNNVQPPITNVALNPQQQVAPNQPVPTPGELQPRPQPVQIVQVGGPSAQQQSDPMQQQPPLLVDPTHVNPQVVTAAPANQPAAGVDDSPIITQVPAGDVPNSLIQAAQRQGEALVMVDSSGGAMQQNARSGSTAPLTATKEYKAEPGDSVSRMALKLLGANTRANRDAIVRANPVLQQDPNKVIVGKTYRIPTSGVADTGQPMSVALLSPVEQPSPQAQPAASVQFTSATEYWYTVKENDSLWRIASEQLGDVGTISAIKELNKDALKGEDTVYVGMKLKLPGKPIAKAN